MKNPVHNIKLYADNNIPCPDSTWYKSAPHWYQNSARGWLGSGVLDKNGVEIYEGDILLYFSIGGKPRKIPVSFRDCRFCYKDIDGEYYPLEPNDAKHFEVVGHIAEETTNENTRPQF